MPLKKVIMTTTLLAGAAFAGSAHAQEGPYFQVHGGANFITNDDVEGTVLGTPFETEYDSDTGYAAGVALGTRINPSWRLEGEVTYRDNDIDDIGGAGVDSNATSTALMGNVYYDFYTESDLKPYIGGGLGYANVDVDGGDDDLFAYQVKAGVAKPVGNGNSDIGVEASYFATEDLEFSDGTDTIEASYGNTSLMAFWRTRL